MSDARRHEHELLTVIYEAELSAHPSDSGVAPWRGRAATATAEVDRLTADSLRALPTHRRET